MGAAIQFFGKESVLEAFTARDAAGWSLLQGKQFLFKGSDVNELETILNMLQPSGSAAIYTLRVYDDVNENDIKSKTDFDGSFNFRLNEPLTNDNRTESNYFNNRLSEIEARIAGISDDITDNDVEIVDAPKSAIETLLNNPAIAAVMPLLIEKLINFLTNATAGKAEQQENNQTGGAGYAIENRSEANTPKGSEAASIARLSRIDKDFTKNLEKLAGIAETKPELYKMLTENLKNF